MTEDAEPGPASELATVDWSRFDFIDLGCSRGRSLERQRIRYAARRGLGVDLNPARVEAVRDAGGDAVCADARALDVEDVVRFVSMSDFLEHLPDLEAVREVIASAARAATDFLYIFHPSFEGKEVAYAAGFKQYWWDWRVHTAHIRIDDYCQMFDALGLRRYCIRYVKRVSHSGHPTVLPLTAPADQNKYDPSAHGPKHDVEFARPLWRAQEIFVALRDMPAAEWDRVTAPWKKTPLRELVA